MPIEKTYTIKKKQTNFTQIHNVILQKLRNYEALGLYCYIYSLPSEWKFYKSQLSSHAGIGREKLDKLLRILKNHGLIHIEQIRYTDGRFGRFNMHVYDVEEFINSPSVDNSPPLTEKPLTVNREPENSNYKYNKNKYIKNRESSSLKNLDNSKSDQHNGMPKAKSQKPKAKSQKPKAKSQKPKAKSQKPKAKSQKPKLSTKTSCPSNIYDLISDESILIAQEKNIDINKVALSFKDYAMSQGWLRMDWKAALRKWIRSEKVESVKSSYKPVENKIHGAAYISFDDPRHPSHNLLKKMDRNKKIDEKSNQNEQEADDGSFKAMGFKERLKFETERNKSSLGKNNNQHIANMDRSYAASSRTQGQSSILQSQAPNRTGGEGVRPIKDFLFS